MYVTRLVALDADCEVTVVLGDFPKEKCFLKFTWLERMMCHMPIVAHQYLMLFYVLTADSRCRALAYRADLYPGPQLQNGKAYELQTFTVMYRSTRCK